MDGACESAVDGDLQRGQVALDARAVADDDLRGVNIAGDAAENLRRAFADDVAGDDDAGTKGRNRVRRGSRRGSFVRPHVAGSAVGHGLFAAGLGGSKVAQCFLLTTLYDRRMPASPTS